MLKSIVDALPVEAANRIRSSSKFEKAVRDALYPVAFDVVESVVMRGTLEQLVRKELSVPAPVPTVTKLLADWPFAGYITSNYDGLLAKALRLIRDEGPAWTVVGNTRDEIRKLGAGESRRVWHIHGSLDIPDPDRSRLILTTADYTSAYGVGSPIQQFFSALLMTHRLVFVGFGFNDRYLIDVLANVAKINAHPSRPVIAILADSVPEERRRELSQTSNVEVLTYPASTNHENLQAFLELHGYLVYARSHHPTKPARPCPSFDEETIGFLLYNELCLKDSARVADDVLLPILEMKVLANLSTKGVASTAELAADLQSRVTAIRGASARVDETSGVAKEMKGALLRLQETGFIDLVEGGGVRLTPKGTETVGKKRLVAGEYSDEFSTAILSRVEREGHNLSDAACRRIATIAESFFKQSVSRRGLAVAVALATSNEDQKQHSIIGLLQYLREYISSVYSADEALPLIKTVIGVLTNPSISERKYLAVLLQATFSMSLLGFDAATINTRVREVRTTAFLLDSSVLVPYFAHGSTGHPSAKSLLEKLRQLGCNVFTTVDFVRELTSHALKAKNYFRNEPNPQSTRHLDRLTRETSPRQNAFVEGFLRTTAAAGTILKHQGMQQYLAGHCGLRLVLGSKADNIEVVADAVRSAGVRVLDSERLLSIDATRRARGYERSIKVWREHVGSAGHPEQALAEANATTLVEEIRARRIEGVGCPHSYFVTTTRFVDQLTAERVVFSPDPLLQFLITLSGWSADELDVLGSNLFSEFIERNIVLLDDRQLATVFMPLVDLSKASMEDFTAKWRHLAIAKWGQDEVDRWDRVNDVDLPVLADRVHLQVIEDLERDYERLRVTKETDKVRAALTEDERSELLRYREKARDRSRKKINRRGSTKGRGGTKPAQSSDDRSSDR